jgi:hypothetical protein
MEASCVRSSSSGVMETSPPKTAAIVALRIHFVDHLPAR